MRHIVALSAILMFGWSIQAQELVAKLDWQKLATNNPGQFTAVKVDGRWCARIENTKNEPVLIPLATIQKPGISNRVYAIRGEIKYENVEGAGYLEMWTYVLENPGDTTEEQYFTKTVNETGPMGKIVGNSPWRLFVLPFNQLYGESGPAWMQLNLYLPGKGIVWIGETKLERFPNATMIEQTFDAPWNPAWWSPRISGWVGGIGGSLIGCLAAINGVFAAKGRGRKFVVGTSVALIVLGALLLVAGLTALSLQQPYHVWYLLLLPSILLLVIMPFRLRDYLRRYNALAMSKKDV